MHSEFVKTKMLEMTKDWRKTKDEKLKLFVQKCKMLVYVITNVSIESRRNKESYQRTKGLNANLIAKTNFTQLGKSWIKKP